MDTALKQRLVGASVLIALAVVVLPMLLGGRPDGEVQKTQKIELPPQPSELDFQTRRYPIGERPAGQIPKSESAPVKPLPTPGAASGLQVQGATETVPEDQAADSAPAEMVSEETSEEVVPEPVAGEAPAKVVVTPLPSPGSATADPGRYIVQVASFGSLDNANRLASTLRGYGYSVMLDSIKSDVGTLHRVRVGPFADEAGANGAVSRLQSQVSDVKPRVMDLQPEKAAPVSQPSDPMVRWVVQVGSFSDATNADKLVARLRLESMSAYREQVSRSGTVIYRVRVGPFLEREDAIKADTLVAERLFIDGVVMSAD